MSRVTVLVLAVFVAVAAHAETAEELLVGEGKAKGEEKEAVRCRACKFPCPEGTVNCWACGSHVPGAGSAKRLAPVKLVRMVFRRQEDASSAGADALSPVLKLDKIESWIAENPDEHDGAIKRLSDLLQEVRGTGLEAEVTTRVQEARSRKIEAERPKTPEEREAEAASAYLEVMREVRKTDDPYQRVKKLQRLLKIARDTDYEDAVLRALWREKEKAKRP